MLPFLQKRAIGDAIVAKRHNRFEDVTHDPKPEEKVDPELYMACSELLIAIETKDIPKMIKAMHSIHELTDLEEHYEGPHLGEY